jgi:hypothetical protein
MQPFSITDWPNDPVPRRSAPGRRRPTPPRRARWQPGPTLMFTGVALSILGTATILATCIASF